MTERLTLSVKHSDGQEWSATLDKEAIALDEMTWEWLKGAFVAVGYNANQVDDFFNDSNVGESK